MRRASPGALLAAGGALLVATSLLSIRFGATPLSAAEIWSILGERLGFTGGAKVAPWQTTILMDVRLPRIATGVFVGAGLAVSGASLQALFRNPLADPGVLGVASGASLGAVFAIQVGLAALSAWAVPALAIVGAALTAFTVYGIAASRGRLPVATLLLAGVAVGSLASALTSLVLSLSLEEYEQGRQAFRWLMGGLEARTWSDVLLVAPATLLGSSVIVASGRELDALLVGESQALALGVDVPRVRRRLIIATSTVIGAAVAVSGVLGFVGLVIPHVVRLLVGPSHGRLLPASMVFGAVFLVGADLLCRTLRAPEEIRLGVMTASVGAPFFLFLLLARRGEASLA